MGMLELFLESRLLANHRPSVGQVVWIAFVLIAALPKWSQFER